MEIANQLSGTVDYIVIITIVHGKIDTWQYTSLTYLKSKIFLSLLHCNNHCSEQTVCHSCQEVVQTTSYQGGGRNIRGTRWMWLQQKNEIILGPGETNYSSSSNKISTAVRESRSGFCSEMQLCSNLLLLASPRQHQFNSTDCTKRRISSLPWIIVAIKGRAENSKWWQRWSFSRDIKSLAGRRQVHLPCNPKIESLYHFWERLWMTALWGRVMHCQKK